MTLRSFSHAFPVRAFHFETKFHRRFYQDFGNHVVMKTSQLFGNQKTNFLGHDKAMRREVGVIKLTAKPASVLANKPQ